jgi:sphingomyelin phosphodiesterase acid-like 3
MLKTKQYWCYLFVLIFCTFTCFASKFEPRDNNFLVVTDIHLNKKSMHVMDFTPTRETIKNDLDYPSFQKLMTKISSNIKVRNNIPQPKFILILGDIQGHSRILNDVVDNEAAVFTTFKEQFPKTPIFYVFGNNDSLKSNYGPFMDKNGDSPYTIAMTKGNWKNGFLSTGLNCKKTKEYPCISTENRYNGYYSALIESKLRLIALNSILFSVHSNGSGKKDAINQLKWFEEQLIFAKKNQESVLIALHIPPGHNIYNNSAFWRAKDLANFLAIINTYQKNIIGILSSHTHQEEIKVIKNKSRENITGIFATAALSTAYENAPSVKTFNFSKQDKHWFLSNYTTYYFSKNNSKLELQKLYDFNSYYCNKNNGAMFKCLESLTPEKLKRYLTAGNTKVAGIMKSPNDMFIS